MSAHTLIAAFLFAMSQFYVASGVTTNFNATFDTLTPIIEDGPISPVGIYLDISFTSFDFSQPASAVAGLIPQSNPIYIFGAGSVSNPAAMTVLYQGSELSSFALSSLHYGCSTTLAGSAASLPVPCTITATGYSAGSLESGTLEPVAVQEFVFSPAAAWRVPLAFGRFDGAFQGLERVTYVQSPAAGTEFFLDNIVGTVSS